MIHYVLLVQPTVVGMPGFLSKSFINVHESLNIVPEIPRASRHKFATIEEAENILENDGFRPIKEIKNINSWSIDEFAMNNGGEISAFWYDESGKLVNSNHWIFDRTEKATYAATKKI